MSSNPDVTATVAFAYWWVYRLPGRRPHAGREQTVHVEKNEKGLIDTDRGRV